MLGQQREHLLDREELQEQDESPAASRNPTWKHLGFGENQDQIFLAVKICRALQQDPVPASGHFSKPT